MGSVSTAERSGHAIQAAAAAAMMITVTGSDPRSRDPPRQNTDVNRLIATGRLFVQKGAEFELRVADISQSLPRILRETPPQKPSGGRR